ncbi:MAG: two-component regulator propeller domain-containing protein [Fuerstiella sp.]|nr:two-component regulator propeller domain-containing protein [Fuerstiella sp.]
MNRYDGASITVYQNDPEDVYSLSDNNVKSLLEDRDGNLWVGCDKGLNRYDRNLDAFIRYEHQQSDPESISQNSIPAICAH